MHICLYSGVTCAPHVLLSHVGKMPFRVVVVGGGVSGLVAARQLMYFGVEVVVVESRVGGKGGASSNVAMATTIWFVFVAGQNWWACPHLS